MGKEVATVILIVILLSFSLLFFFFRIDTFSNEPYWSSNYTSSYVSLVAKKYGDIVVGKLVYIYLKFLLTAFML